MKKFFLVIVLIMVMLGNVQSQIFPDPATLSTGQGAPGTFDPIWIASPWFNSSPPNPMGLSYSPALINNNCAPGAWVDPASLPPPVNNGNWITGSGSPCTGSAGYIYFRLTLNLPPDCNGNSVTTVGNYVLYFSGYADNGISDVFINGNSMGISGGSFAPGGQLNITLPGPWVAGINYVDVLVYNGGGPYGLLLVANSTQSSLADGDHDGTSDINDQCPCQAGSKSNGCPASIVGDTIICKGENTTLTSTGTGTYLWNTGSTNVSITINPSLTARYRVIVTTSTGFKDSAAVNVTVLQPPLINVTGDTLLCKGESTTLTATGGGTYFWSTGSVNSSITATPVSTINYKVVVTGTNGCKDSINKNVTVFPKPVASFTFTNKCNGTAIPFVSTSSINTPGVITNWNWDFGDTTFATGSNTSHNYSHPGNYNVTLIITSNYSCADTIVHQITVFNNPVASFTSNDVCFRDSTHFINTSTANLPALLSGSLWAFDDSSPTSSLTNPVHYYSMHGTYNVTLIITTADGCSNAITNPVKVFDPPTSAFTFSNTCLFNSAAFTNTTVSPTMGSTANWSWNFGDGSPINTSVLSPQHLYSIPGNYQVTLITHSSNLGCPDTLQSSITVFPMPVANYSCTNVCLYQPMNFNDSSTIAGGSITGWSWDFGDASLPITTQHPSHIFATPGIYYVTLMVTTNNSCKDTIVKSVVVHPLPVAQYSAINVCNGMPVNFIDDSHIPATDTIQSWKWNFSDGSPLISNQSPSHLYASAGNYSVQLLIVSKFGCMDSITKISIVHPNPVVNFTGDNKVGCEPLCVNFQDSSSLATGVNTLWLWSFGDGSPPVTSKNSNRCYTNDSVFSPIYLTVNLTVASDSGCVTTKSKNNYITVYPNPIANFVVQPSTASIINPVISITDLSIGTNFWHWSFGDHDTSSLHNTMPHNYADTGIYTITLKISTVYDCIDSAYQTITIEPDFVFYVPSAFSPDGDGVNDTFSGKGVFVSEYSMSIFDRWGNLIFFSENINIPWDGKANHGSEIAARDVYVYSIKITDFNKRKHSYKGLVTLLR